MGWFIGTSILLGSFYLAYFLISYRKQEDENGQSKWVRVANPTYGQVWTIAKIFIVIICLISFISQCGERDEVHQKSMKKVQDAYNRNYR